MAATTITRATITDDSGSGTDGTILNSAWFGTAIYDNIDALFTDNVTIEEQVTGTLTLQVSNTANTSTDHVRLHLKTQSTSAGDPYILFEPSGGSVWSLGLDNSGSAAFKLCQNGDLTTSDKLTVSLTGNIVPGSAALGTTATDGFIYLQSCAGTPTGTPTSYTGRVACVYDTSNEKLYVYNGAWKSVTLA